MIDAQQIRHTIGLTMGSGNARCRWILIGVVGLLPACSHPPVKVLPQPDMAQTGDRIPRHEPLCKKGNPESYEVFGERYRPMKSSTGYRERGIASWYGPTFHGRNTSCGTVYNMYEMTAAHKLLPIPTYVAVTNIDNGRRVIVKVNDRGPFHGDRIIDLSYAAALKLGIVQQGTGHVEVQALDPSAPSPTATTPMAQSTPAIPSAEVNGDSGAHPSEPITTHLTKRAADRLADEVEELPPERNPLDAAERFDDQAESGPQLALRASDRGVQILPASVSTPVALPEVPSASAPQSAQLAGTPAVLPAQTQSLPTPQSSMAMKTLAESETTAGQSQFLQVGAFAERENAERLRSQLAAVVQENIAIQHAVDGKGLYRVHIGPLSDASTGRVRATLLRLALPSQLVVN